MVTDKLQQVLNAAACAVMNTHKHDRGLHHTVRHKLSDCTELRIALIMCCCLHGTALEYTSLPLEDHLDTLDSLPATSSSFHLSNCQSLEDMPLMCLAQVFWAVFLHISRDPTAYTLIRLLQTIPQNVLFCTLLTFWWCFSTLRDSVIVRAIQIFYCIA